MFQINDNIVFKIPANKDVTSNQWCYLSMSGSSPVLAIPSITAITTTTTTTTTIATSTSTSTSTTTTANTIPDGIIWNITRDGAAAGVGFQISQSITDKGSQTYHLNCNTIDGRIELVANNTETGTHWCCTQTEPGAGRGCFIFALTQNGSRRFISGSVSESTASLSALDYPSLQWASPAVWSWGLAVKVSIDNSTITFDPPINTAQYQFLRGTTHGFLVFFMDPANAICNKNNPTNEPWTFTSFVVTGSDNATMTQSYNASSSVTVVEFNFQVNGKIDFQVVATNGNNRTQGYALKNGDTAKKDPQVSNSGQSSGGGY